MAGVVASNLQFFRFPSQINLPSFSYRIVNIDPTHIFWVLPVGLDIAKPE